MRSEISSVIWLVVVVAIVYFRLLRPVKLRASRLWIGPVLLTLLGAFVAFGSYERSASPAGIAIAIVAGIALGLPFGLLRGRHTRVRSTGDSRVLVVEPSFIPLAIWFVAFAGRAALRIFLPHAGPVALAASDGFLAFAVAMLIGARLVIAQRFKNAAVG
ncbi:MAG: hypothetical protein ACRENA_08295 [Vulcanimicrobiaceae bacterium]